MNTVRQEILELLKNTVLLDKGLKRKILYGLIENNYDGETLLGILLFLRKEEERLKEYMKFSLNKLSKDDLIKIKGNIFHTKLLEIKKLENDNK